MSKDLQIEQESESSSFDASLPPQNVMYFTYAYKNKTKHKTKTKNKQNYIDAVSNRSKDKKKRLEKLEA